jgi:hypothetical protein
VSRCFGQVKRVLIRSIVEAVYNGHTKVVSLLLAAETLGDKKEFRFGDGVPNLIDSTVGNGNVELVNLLLEAKTIVPL